MKVYIMGIGGAGMSAIARILLARGYEVIGDDRSHTPILDELRAEGIATFVGHDIARLEGVDALAPTSAIAKDDPILIEARKRGVKIWHRGDLLNILLEGKAGIGIAGAHGKTTTTDMVSTVLAQSGLDPSFIIGAVSSTLKTNARHGEGDAFVLEADEYDRTFLRYANNLTIAVITNVEFDHPDIFKDYNDTLNTFAHFAAGIKQDGLLITCADDCGCDDMLKRLASLYPEKASEEGAVAHTDYGIKRGAWRALQLRANPIGGTDFVATSPDGRNVPVSLRVPGEHNVLNALAALVVADACAVPLDRAAEILGGYHSAARRFQFKGEKRGCRVFDDYGHHPTEIRATLAGARMRFPVGNIWAIWQPHTFSRTVALLDQFGGCFKDADHVMVLPIYAAREKPEDFGFAANAINPIEIARKIKHSDVRSAASMGDALGMLMSQVRPGDVIITFSAGDGNVIGERLLELLK
jgi:UDP-N-acetylmuramate--alanine ligase